ncbi:MAG TPA: hypothetical protein VKZ18_28845 [Polyangia bacterium]|nr:hypothetical protein [Polyangia bacterium]
MTVRRYPIGAVNGLPAELRVVVSNGLVVVALHRADRCASGPLAIPAAALDTLRSALSDVAGETGHEAATEPDLAATGTARNGRAIP